MVRWAGHMWKTGGQVSCLMDYGCTSSCSQSAVITRIWAIIKGEIRLCSFLPIKAVQLCRKELKIGQESRRAVVVSWILGFRGFSSVLLLSQRDGVRMPVDWALQERNVSFWPWQCVSQVPGLSRLKDFSACSKAEVGSKATLISVPDVLRFVRLFAFIVLNLCT